jgi:hypothetical protein
MFIEYLESGSDDCPLIRIFGEGPQAVETLAMQLQAFGEESGTNLLEVEKLPGMISIDGFHLTIVKTAEKSKAQSEGTAGSVVWRLPAASVLEVAELLASLGNTKCSGYQWVSGKEARGCLGHAGIGIVVTTDSLGRW